MKIITLKEPEVIHQWCRFDGTKEMATELFSILSINALDMVYSPEFHYRPGSRDLRIAGYFLQFGDYFEILPVGGIGEIGHKYRLSIKKESDFSPGYLDRLRKVNETEQNYH